MSRAPTHVPSQWEAQKAIADIHVAMAQLVEIDPDIADDPRLTLDSLEGMTDALEVVDRLVLASVEDEALAEATRALARQITARAARIEKRREALRSIVLAAMQTMRLERLERAGYTVSVRQNAPELIIDEEKLPEIYWRVKREVDRQRLRKLFSGNNSDGRLTIPGVTVGNASQGITVRV